MESGLRQKPPRTDPERWKPLAGFILSAVLAGPLAWVEYLLVTDMIRGRTIRPLFEVLFIGMTLGFCLLGLVKGIRWLAQGPPPPPDVREAEQALARRLSPGLLVSRGAKLPPPNKLIYALLPATFLLMACYGFYVHHQGTIWIALAFTVFFGGLMFFLARLKQGECSETVTIDPERRVIVFENFQFVTGFTGNRLRVREEVAFDQIVGGTYYPADRGPALLQVRTTKGLVALSGRLEYFDAMHAIIDGIVTVNRAKPEQFQASLEAEPVVKTPWYGWLILAAAFGGVVLLGWKLMY